jgi:hypothetical protein
MKKIFIISALISLLLITLSGCGSSSSSSSGGGGGGGGGTPSVGVTASRPVALADNGMHADGMVTITADVRNADGTPAADGTNVTFTAMSTVNPASATTVGGLASTVLTEDPVLPPDTSTITTVTATALGVSGSTDVKFINQPNSVEVFIAFDQAVTNIAALQFILNNTPGAAMFDNGTQPIAAINAAAGSLVFGNFNMLTDSNEIALANAVGFNTGLTPIIQATYDIVGAGLPVFDAALPPAIFIATDPGGGATVPPVTAANVVVTMTYDTE